MRGALAAAAGLLLASTVAAACEVDTAAAVRDVTHGNYVIPVRVSPGQRCVILDSLSEAGRKTRNDVWLPVEKLGNSIPKLGRFTREYQVDGDVAKVDRFVYVAGERSGEDAVVFASFPSGQERRAVEYRIRIE